MEFTPDITSPEEFGETIKKYRNSDPINWISELFRSQEVPPAWKSFKVIAIRKPSKDHNNIRSYKSIALGKIFEKILIDKLTPDFKKILSYNSLVSVGAVVVNYLSELNSNVEQNRSENILTVTLHHTAQAILVRSSWVQSTTLPDTKLRATESRPAEIHWMILQIGLLAAWTIRAYSVERAFYGNVNKGWHGKFLTQKSMCIPPHNPEQSTVHSPARLIDMLLLV